MDHFDSWLGARQYADTTRRVYRIYASRLCAFTDPATATTNDLLDFMEVLPGTAPSKRAARKALVAYYRYLGVDPNPAEQLPRVAEPQRLPRPLTEPEHREWVLASHRLGGTHELAGMLMATTGARTGEVRVARWEDFSLIAPGYWRVRGKGARRRGPIWRQQPLHPEMLALLQRQLIVSPWLFPSPDGSYLSDYRMRKLILEISAEAGLGHVTGHRIRHSVATIALSKTGDLRAVQSLLGHRSVQSTQMYTEVLPDRLHEVIHALPT